MGGAICPNVVSRVVTPNSEDTSPCKVTMARLQQIAGEIAKQHPGALQVHPSPQTMISSNSPRTRERERLKKMFLSPEAQDAPGCNDAQLVRVAS